MGLKYESARRTAPPLQGVFEPTSSGSAGFGWSRLETEHAA